MQPWASKLELFLSQFLKFTIIFVVLTCHYCCFRCIHTKHRSYRNTQCAAEYTQQPSLLTNCCYTQGPSTNALTFCRKAIECWDWESITTKYYATKLLDHISVYTSNDNMMLPFALRVLLSNLRPGCLVPCEFRGHIWWPQGLEKLDG